VPRQPLRRPRGHEALPSGLSQITWRENVARQSPEDGVPSQGPARTSCTPPRAFRPGVRVHRCIYDGTSVAGTRVTL
jgi:hypothetical protein